MNLLILSPDYSKRVNFGHQHVRDSLLVRIKNSLQFGAGCAHNGEVHLPTICKEVEPLIGYPDALLMENWKNYRHYTGVNEIDCIKAFIVCDYYPDARNNIEHYNVILNDYKIDLALCSTPAVLRYIEKGKRTKRLDKRLKAVWVPQGVQTEIFMKRGIKKIYDVMAVFGLVSYVYPNRPAVQELISNMPGVKVLVGDWKSNIKHYDYARAINQSKIFVCSNGVNNQVLMKYFEAMASGTLLLTNVPEDCEAYGLKPGIHFAVWRTLEDLKDKIYHFLSDSHLREKIAVAGMEYVRNYYSTEDIAIKIERELEKMVYGRCPSEIRER